jgi:Hexokinase
MKNNLFSLSEKQLKEIAESLASRIQTGLAVDGTEILSIPTYLNPKTQLPNEKVLVLDLGGTNCRVAIIEFKDNQASIHPKGGWKKDLTDAMKSADATEEGLYKEIADLVSNLNLEGVHSIGYCFSYPAESMLNGDATLLRWTKGVNIPEMIGKPIGKSLIDYLNANVKNASFKSIKVINDTIASLFAGLTDTEAQAHIGLIVGTGTNMATFFPADEILKLTPEYKEKGLVPVNLESGNFNPPHLTVVDNKIDKYSDTKGAQRFEKAISGMYLGRILEHTFYTDELEDNFDAEKLTRIMSYPDMYKRRYVQMAHWIYERSAKLVAASLAGLVIELVRTATKPITKIRLTAEGSLFWSEDRKSTASKFKSYKDLAMDELDVLLEDLGIDSIEVVVEKMDNANLIGSAVAALS